MNRWAWIIGGLLLAGLVITGIGWFFSTHERVEIDARVGPSGMARVNPFWAAELMLDELEVPAESRFGLGVLPPVDQTILVLSTDLDARRALAPQLRRWVTEGGHLLVVAVPPEDEPDDQEPDDDIDLQELVDQAARQDAPLLAIANLRLVRSLLPQDEEVESDAGVDAGPDASASADAGPDGGASADAGPDGGASADAGSDGGAGPPPPLDLREVLRSLGIRPVEREVTTVYLPGEVEPAQIELDQRWTLVTDEEGSTRQSRWAAQGPKVFQPLMTIPVGRGRVTAVVDGWFATNQAIGEHDHARAVWALVNTAGRPSGALLIVRAHAEGLWGLLWRHGWMVILSLLALVLAWVWMASRRFGPLRPDPVQRRRSLLEHIEATGAYLYRQGHQEALMASARAAVKRKLAARLGGDTELGEAELEEAVSKETGIRASRVHQAFSGARPNDRREMIEAMRELQRLWRAK